MERRSMEPVHGVFMARAQPKSLRDRFMIRRRRTTHLRIFGSRPRPACFTPLDLRVRKKAKSLFTRSRRPRAVNQCNPWPCWAATLKSHSTSVRTACTSACLLKARRSMLTRFALPLTVIRSNADGRYSKLAQLHNLRGPQSFCLEPPGFSHPEPALLSLSIPHEQPSSFTFTSPLTQIGVSL